MRYIPSQARPTSDGEYNIHNGIINRIRKSDEASKPDSPEREFIGYIDKGNDLVKHCQDKIQAYVASINKKLQSAIMVQKYLLVAESRRRTFRPPPLSARPKHSLAEFEMSLPYACQLDPNWKLVEMTPSGDVKEMALPCGVWHPRNTQTDFLSSCCPFSTSV
ncbi:MAG: hypothetical protein M1839_002826 [Geoglossum umbratile]|nr:MAG: hypothetical protein M1839_002826 [Geoglossum umbratile]